MSTMITPEPTAGSVTDAPTALEAVDVEKSFAVDGQELSILHGVSLRVQTGEMVAIMGPSGSGKSTLLYCLAGLEQPTGGHVEIHGTRLDQQRRAALARMRRRDVGFVFQSYNLIPTLSAYENVALPYLLARRKPPRESLLETMDRVGLAHRVDARPPSMSGGEQQRTALARVIAQEPRIVFADEPTGALDSRSGRLVMDSLGEMSHDPGRAVLLVTHDPAVAARCDRVLFLTDGRMAGEMSPRSATDVSDALAELTAAKEG
jgi:putative ABC transport system ATP-binding protein